MTAAVLSAGTRSSSLEPVDRSLPRSAEAPKVRDLKKGRALVERFTQAGLPRVGSDCIIAFIPLMLSQ